MHSRVVIAVLLSLSAVATRAADIAPKPLPPTAVRKLASPAYAVAWLDPSTVLLASDGVVAHSIVNGATKTIIRHSAVPDGLPSVDGVATDGHSVAAFTALDNSQFVAKVADSKRIIARTSARFYVTGMAVNGPRLYVLGWPLNRDGSSNGNGAAVWVGALDADWDAFKPVHTVRNPAAQRILNDSAFPYTGSIATDATGNLYVNTSAEAGVYRYDASGNLTGTYGSALNGFVIDRMHEVNYRYATDAEGRYRDVLNVRPTVDSLVGTADGPALIVRTVTAGRVQWELQYPGTGSQGLRARYALGVERPGPYGHMRCSVLGRQMACVFAKPEGTSKSHHLATWTLPAIGGGR